MAETLNKRIRPAVAAEARANALRYWEAKISADRAKDGTDEQSVLPREEQDLLLLEKEGISGPHVPTSDAQTSLATSAQCQSEGEP